MKLSPHFYLSEFTDSERAVREGIDQTPPPEIIEILRGTANQMEYVREILGHPVVITSGWRSLTLNRAIGSDDTSDHIKGYAVDFKCPGFGLPKSIAKKLSECPTLKFDQLIFEGGWVHISFAPRMRRQVLTAHFTPGKKTQYTLGVK